jgi:RNA polymerase sigma-32 factor
MATQALARVSELNRYMAQINQYPVLSAEEELSLTKRWRDLGDIQAAHTLVTANLRFVVKIAHEYRGYGARTLDLIQEGSIGLMHAVKKFDPDRGYRLLTYAVYWIRTYIHGFLMRTTRMIKLGTSRAHRKLFFKLRALKGRLAAKGITDNDEIYESVTQHTGIDRAEVEEMDTLLSRTDTSLDAPVAEVGTALVEAMPAPTPNQEELLTELETKADRAARLDAAFEELDPREKTIIRERYLSEMPRQLKEIGDAMGVSKQRIAQIERRAIKKLKKALHTDLASPPTENVLTI